MCRSDSSWYTEDHWSWIIHDWMICDDLYYLNICALLIWRRLAIERLVIWSPCDMWWLIPSDEESCCSDDFWWVGNHCWSDSLQMMSDDLHTLTMRWPMMIKWPLMSDDVSHHSSHICTLYSMASSAYSHLRLWEVVQFEFQYNTVLKHIWYISV